MSRDWRVLRHCRKHSLMDASRAFAISATPSSRCSTRLLIELLATMAAAATHRSRKRPRQSSNHQDYLFWCYFHSFRILQCWAGKANATSAQRRQQSTSTSEASSTSSSSSSASTSSETNGKMASAKGQLSFRSTCSRNWVRVTSLVLTCDSPGAYYYGSSTYRNSDTCAAGDKARISLSRESPRRV